MISNEPFALTKSASARPELKVYPIPIKPEDLARKVNQFHQRLANRHPDFAGLARELYAILIEPARKQLVGISTICIVPDGFPVESSISSTYDHNQ